MKNNCSCENKDSKMLDIDNQVVKSDRELLLMSSLLKILANETRLKIIWALNDSEKCVCELVVLLDMTKSAISHQLKLMKEYHVVKSRKSGKNVIYSLDDEHIMDIVKTVEIHVNHNC